MCKFHRLFVCIYWIHQWNIEVMFHTVNRVMSNLFNSTINLQLHRRMKNEQRNETGVMMWAWKRRWDKGVHKRGKFKKLLYECRRYVTFESRLHSQIHRCIVTFSNINACNAIQWYSVHYMVNWKQTLTKFAKKKSISQSICGACAAPPVLQSNWDEGKRNSFRLNVSNSTEGKTAVLRKKNVVWELLR